MLLLRHGLGDSGHVRQATQLIARLMKRVRAHRSQPLHWQLPDGVAVPADGVAALHTAIVQRRELPIVADRAVVALGHTTRQRETFEAG